MQKDIQKSIIEYMSPRASQKPVAVLDAGAGLTATAFSHSGEPPDSGNARVPLVHI
jgi:hypothetical protein